MRLVIERPLLFLVVNKSRHFQMSRIVGEHPEKLMHLAGQPIDFRFISIRNESPP